MPLAMMIVIVEKEVCGVAFCHGLGMDTYGWFPLTRGPRSTFRLKRLPQKQSSQTEKEPVVSFFLA
jgi:hypothetical protein